MLLKTTPVLVALVALLSAAAVRAEGTMSAAPSTPAGKNMIWNGAFDGVTLRPWSAMVDSPRFGSSAVTGGELCFKLAEPSPHGVDVVLRQRPIAIAKGHHYQLRLKVHATAPTKVRPRLSKISVPYTELWGATIDADTTAKTYAGDVRRHRRRRQRRAGGRIRRPAGREAAADGLHRRRRAERSAVRGAHPAGARRARPCARTRSATCPASPRSRPWRPSRRRRSTGSSSTRAARCAPAARRARSATTSRRANRCSRSTSRRSTPPARATS